MKKLGIGLAFAVALLMSPVSSKPANAGTTEIIAAVVGAIVVIASLNCAIAAGATTEPFICLLKQAPPSPDKKAKKGKKIEKTELKKNTYIGGIKRDNYEQLAAAH